MKGKTRRANRRHHNNKGRTSLLNDKRAEEAKRIAEKLGIEYKE